jgi:large subunit ribosomal protein L15
VLQAVWNETSGSVEQAISAIFGNFGSFGNQVIKPGQPSNRRQKCKAAIAHKKREIQVPTNLSNLRPPKGATANKKRVGRGMGSGMGKTSTRGHKGQRSRSGSRMMRGFEGGQMPLHRRLPKRGFTNIFRVEYQIVNLDRLAELGEKNITPELLVKNGVVHKNDLIKVLGDGELKTALTVQAHKFSKSAEEKITKAGGKIEIIGGAAVAAPAKDESQTGKSKAPSKLKKKVT